MRTKLATYALAGALGLFGVAGAALVAPAVSYATTGDSTALDASVTSLKQALAGLVSDGSITQAQADEVVTTIAEARPEGLGRGGHGGGGRVDMGAAAEVLGISEEELRTQTQAGRTLADIAEAEGVPEADLLDALVAAAETRLAEAVTAGRLTQAEARRPRRRPRGPHHRVAGRALRSWRSCRPGGPGDDAAEDAPTSAPSASTSSDV